MASETGKTDSQPRAIAQKAAEFALGVGEKWLKAQIQRAKSPATHAPAPLSSNEMQSEAKAASPCEPGAIIESSGHDNTAPICERGETETGVVQPVDAQPPKPNVTSEDSQTLSEGQKGWVDRAADIVKGFKHGFEGRGSTPFRLPEYVTNLHQQIAALKKLEKARTGPLGYGLCALVGCLAGFFLAKVTGMAFFGGTFWLQDWNVGDSRRIWEASAWLISGLIAAISIHYIWLGVVAARLLKEVQGAIEAVLAKLDEFTGRA